MRPALTPELYVTNLETSLNFYCDLLGFQISYQRPEDRFAFLTRDGVAIMLEEPIGRTWLAGPLEQPFGRGMNLQILVRDVAQIYADCQQANVTLQVALETKTYRRRDDMVSQTQFVVQDPDGYLIRLAEEIDRADTNETNE